MRRFAFGLLGPLAVSSFACKSSHDGSVPETQVDANFGPDVDASGGKGDARSSIAKDGARDAPPGFDVYVLAPAWKGGEPVPIAAATDGGGSTSTAIAIAVDQVATYWQTPGGSIYACALPGCGASAPSLLSSLTGPAGVQLDSLVAASGAAVFLSTSGQAISIVPFDLPNDVSSLAAADADAGTGYAALATDGAHVYFLRTATDPSGNTSQSIASCAIGAPCATPALLYTAPADATLATLTVANAEVVFSEFNYDGSYKIGLLAVPSTGGAARTVCGGAESGALVTSMTATRDEVYYTTAQGSSVVYECPLAGTGTAGVFVHDYQPYALATDGTNVYWTNYVPVTGTVAGCKASSTCTAPFTVASDQPSPFAIAATASTLYWTTSKGIFTASIPE
jgi:hypothetical protein